MFPANASCSDLSEIDLDEWMDNSCLKELVNKDALGLLRDISDDKIQKNTEGPFFRGTIGNDTEYLYGMHVVFSVGQTNEMVTDTCKNLDSSRCHTLFVAINEVYARLPPRIRSGDLHSCAMDSYVTYESIRVFEDGQGIKCKDGHVRSVSCDEQNVYVSGIKIVDAFKYKENVVFVTEHVLPFMWIDEHEKPRKHQVKDRRIRPAVTIHSFGFDEKECNVHIRITEPDCESFLFADAVVPSTLELISVTRNMCDCNLTPVTIRHKPTHSGYNNKTYLNMSIRDKRTKIELTKLVHEFHMHNSGHTLPEVEKEWRKFDKNTPRNEEIPENNTKETMTDHQFSNPPLARSLVQSKKRRVSYMPFNHEPPPLHATQLPHKDNSFSSIQGLSAHPVQPYFSPLRAIRNDSPTSPLELHKELKMKKRNMHKCGKCFFGIDESDDFEYVCDKCGAFFHYECTSLQETIEDDEFVCDFCLV